MEDGTFDLPAPPDGWASTTMGEVSQVVGGSTPDTRDAGNFCEDGGHPWLTPADLSGFREMYISRGARNLTDNGLANSSAKLMPKGVVMMSSRAPIGYLAIAMNTIATNQGFKSFVCSDALLPEYLFFWLKFVRPLVEHMASGSTFPEVSGAKAREIPVLIPPLPEQRRIVERVEALLARVNAARDRLATVPAILKRFRQAVLAAACSGRLTEEWRRQHRLDEPAGSWRTMRVTEWLSGPMANGRSVPDAESGFPVLRLTALRNGRVDLSQRKIGDWTGEAAARFLVCKGDFLVARGNGSLSLVGRGGLVEENPDAVAYPDTVIRIRPRTDLIAPQYLRWVWDSDAVREQIESAAHTSAGIHKVSQKDLAEIAIPVPSLKEQEEIARRTRSLFEFADTIERRVTAAATRADKLTQAILARAFRGELVPTEAELARQEGRDYEPASVLLERVGRERGTTAAPAGRTRRRAVRMATSSRTGARGVRGRR